MKESKINYFKYKKKPGKEILSVAKILDIFSSSKFKHLIERGRDFYKRRKMEEYNLLKGKLIAVTFSGTFFPDRTLENLINYTGYIILDLDRCGHLLSSQKEELTRDEYVHAVWLSPSGDGLKFLIKTANEAIYHKLVYYSAVEYFKEKYNLNVDTTGSDIPRLCYVSYDSNIYINSNAKLYNEMIREEDEVALSKKIKARLKISFERDVHVDKKNFTNSSFDKERLKRIYHYLCKRGLSITSSYNDWVRVAFAISNSFNYDFGYNWFLKFAQLDGSYYDENESIKLISRCYNTGISQSTFGTIQYLAGEQGWMNFKRKTKT